MENEALAKLQIIRETKATCESYHKQKEDISWVALAALLAATVAIVRFMLGEGLGAVQTVCLLVFGLFVVALTYAFIARQIDWKNYELQMMNAAGRVLAKCASGKMDAAGMNVLCPEGEHIPAVVLEELGWKPQCGRVFNFVKENSKSYERATRAYAALCMIVFALAMAASAAVSLGRV